MSDLSDLWLTGDGPAQPMLYRQGKIMAWDAVTLDNTIRVDGVDFHNLPVLGVAEAASYTVGSTVGIALVGDSWSIIGRFVRPGTAAAKDAITQLARRTFTAEITSAETTNSGTFTDLATVGPRVGGVQIPASGQALVILGATVAHGFDAFFGAVGVEARGPTVVNAELTECLWVEGDTTVGASRAVLMSGLTPGGLYTFTLKYITDGFDVTFSGRTITVITI